MGLLLQEGAVSASVDVSPNLTLVSCPLTASTDNRTPEQKKLAAKMKRKGDRRTDFEMIARRANRVKREQHEKVQREKLHAQIEAEGPKVWKVDDAVLEKRKTKSAFLRNLIKASEEKAKEQADARKAFKARRIKF